MTHAAKVLADSISPDGVRLTTLEVTFPRIVLAEFNTHRMLSRNSASSRAIPVEKMIRMVEEHPYVPTHWGKNQKGMQAEQELSEEIDGYEPIGDKPDRAMQATSPKWRAIGRWHKSCASAVEHARALLEIGVHKQITNRLLECYMWHTVIASGTEWSNFFHLRRHRDAHPEIKLAADLMFAAMEGSKPTPLAYGEWHMPLTNDEEIMHTPLPGSKTVGGITDIGIDHRYIDYSSAVRAFWKKVSVARCARVSYLTHDGKRDPQADIDMAENKLGMHMSPWEHVARPMGGHNELGNWSDPLLGVVDPQTTFCGNFRGWVQMRKQIPNENDILGGA